MSSFILHNFASYFLKPNNTRIPIPLIHQNCLKSSSIQVPFSHLFTLAGRRQQENRRGGCKKSRGGGSQYQYQYQLFSSTITSPKSSSSPCCSSSSIMSSPNPLDADTSSNNKVIEVDIISYLNAIENELFSLPNNSFRVKVRQQNRRPMIRTLLGIESKDDFYTICRLMKAKLEYDKMLKFALMLRDELEKNYELDFIHDTLPCFLSTIDELLSSASASTTRDDNHSSSATSTDTDTDTDTDTNGNNENYHMKRGLYAFARLASGRAYKGKLMDMVQDLTPDLAEQCDEAMTPITDAQVLLEVIDLIAKVQNINVTNHNCNEGSGDNDVTHAVTSLSTSLISPSLFKTTINEQCIKAAKECVIHLHNPNNNNNNNNSHDEDDTIVDDNGNNNGNHNINILPKLNGIECEQACITYLEEMFESSAISNSNTSILQNVLVNHVSTQSRSKYSKGNMKTNKGGWRNLGNPTDSSEDSESDSSCPTGILWTNTGSREKVCSEFDALIVHTLSPSSSEEDDNDGDDGDDGDDDDDDTKKEAQCRISEFWEAKYSVSPSSLHDAITKKLSAVRLVVNDADAKISYNGNHYAISENKSLTRFGLFGMELLSPENAIGQLKSTAASYALVSFMDVALEAAETGYVDVKVEYLQQHLHGLKQALLECKDFEIIVRIVR